MSTLTHKSGAAWNESFWENDRFNELLIMGKGELDNSKRAEIYREMGMTRHSIADCKIGPGFVFTRESRYTQFTKRSLRIGEHDER